MRVLDRLRTARRYGNRSEFVRDLLRAELVKEEWAHEEGETVGALRAARARHRPAAQLSPPGRLVDAAGAPVGS
jgi:metal-responsive CopG/Arc/MetJ family transcriptional regulator